MANGKHGDHPLTDILLHKRAFYGTEADDLIREIGRVSSRRELDEWWEREIGWSGGKASVAQKARTHLNELLERAKQGGWEIR